MKHWKISLLVLLIAFTNAQTASADNAVGIVIGDPTGLSGRLGIDGAHSFEGALAYSVGQYDGLHIHGTYLWDHARSWATSSGPLELYYGLGARIISISKGKHEGEVAVGPRAPIGLLFNVNNPNLEIFGELAATLDIAPHTDVDLDVGIGVRIRF